MNILETFFYLFESDASKLDEGLKESDQAAKGVEKTLDAVDKRAQMVGSSMLELVKGLGAGLVAGLSAGALVAMVRNASEAVYVVDELSDALGLNASELEAWDAAANAAGVGGSLGGLTNSMRTFNERVQDLARRESPELLRMFQQVGLSLDDVKAKASDPLALLREMADGMHELSAAEAVGLGQKLGLDIGTVNLLRQGKAGLDEIVAAQKELGFITDEQIERNRAYRDALDRLNRIMADVRRRVVFTVLPALERLANFFEGGARLAREHAGAIKWGAGLIALALTGMLVPALIRAAAATRALWIAMARFIPLGAALAAVGLIAEDLFEFMRGGDSAIGRLVERWPALGAAIRGVGNVLAWVIALVASVGDAFLTLFTDGPEAAFERFREGIRRIGADVEAMFPSLAGFGAMLSGVAEAALVPFRALVAFVRGATATIAALILEGPRAALRELGDAISRHMEVWRRLLDLIRRAVAAIPGVGALVGAAGRLLGRGSDPAPAGVAQGQLQLAAVAAAPVGNVSSAAVLAGATNNRSTSVQVDRVEVNTQATDADGIAQGIGGALEREMRSAADAFDDGVAA